MTALLAALARGLFGWSLVGLRAFTILASAGTVLVGALVARELGASRRAQTLAAVIIGFGPGMLATNLLFQPVALDQLTTMIVLWLALRLALGRGSWPLLGLAVGIGLETKYTTRRRPRPAHRDLPRLAPRRPAIAGPSTGCGDRGRRCSSRTSSGRRPTAGRACTGSSTRRRAAATRRGRCSSSNVILLTRVGSSRSPSPESCRSSAIARCARSAGRLSAPSLAYFVLGGKSYYALPVLVFALAAGAIPLDRWATRRRLQLAGAVVRGGRPSRPCRSRCRCCRCTRPSGTASSRRAATTSRRSAGPPTCAWSSGTRPAPT